MSARAFTEPNRNSLGTRHSNQLGQPLAFSAQNPLAKTSQSIIDPSLVIQFGIWALVGSLNEAIFKQPLDTSIEGPRSQPYLAFRPFCHLFHDSVAVLVCVCQGQQ